MSSSERICFHSLRLETVSFMCVQTVIENANAARHRQTDCWPDCCWLWLLEGLGSILEVVGCLDFGANVAMLGPLGLGTRPGTA